MNCITNHQYLLEVSRLKLYNCGQMARTIWRSSSLIIFPELTDECLLLWIMDKYEGYVIKTLLRADFKVAS